MSPTRKTAALAVISGAVVFALGVVIAVSDSFAVRVAASGLGIAAIGAAAWLLNRDNGGGQS